MTHTATHSQDHHAHHEHETSSKVLYGFWLFILSDFVLFATLFACYAVLSPNTYGGIGIQQVATLPYVLVASLLLLTCSFTYGLSAVSAQNLKKGLTQFWLLITLLFGLGFVGMEYHEFANLFLQGYTWQNSAFLSAFFALVGIHWLHTLVALIWIVILMIQLASHSISSTMRTKLACLGLFIHFLNIIWIFIFTVVYLMGAM